MDFRRLDDAVAACKAHLDATGARGTEVENFLVSYLLVTIAAEYEVRLEAMVVKRAERANDAHIHSFIAVAADRFIRGIKISEISGILGHFSAQYKEAFATSITGTPAQVAYDNILNNRHAIAHNAGVQMTFTELEAALPSSKLVLESAAVALTLTAAELAAL